MTAQRSSFRLGCALAAVTALASQAGCSLGQGAGEVYSSRLVARDCWGVGQGVSPENAEYDLKPDFFAAVPYRSTLQIRVQRGNDLQEVSDGLSVLVDDVDEIRRRIDALRASGSDAPVKLCVALPPGVAPPGTPVGVNGPGGGACPDGEAALVHMALYLQRSCHNQNIVLYAVSGSIEIRELFSGDPQEKDAAQKLTEVPSFDVLVGDPRDAPIGEGPLAIPQELQSRITGFFSFYFERGQPGQPFP